MQSSGTSGNTSDSPPHRWASIMGTAIAVLTLTLPLLAIAYYSSSKTNVEPLPRTNYSFVKKQ